MLKDTRRNSARKSGKHRKVNSFIRLICFLNISSNISNINISSKYKERREFSRDEAIRRKRRKKKVWTSFRGCQRDDLALEASSHGFDNFQLNLHFARVFAHFCTLRHAKRQRRKNVFIHPKATRLFNNSFERRNFQLLLMVSQGLLLAHLPIHVNISFVSKDSTSNKTLKKATTGNSGNYFQLPPKKRCVFENEKQEIKAWNSN